MWVKILSMTMLQEPVFLISFTLIAYPYSGPSLPIAETITTPFAVSSQTFEKQ